MIKATAVSGVPFALILGLLFSYQSGNPRGLAFGFGAGLLFGLSLAVFAEWQPSRFALQASDLECEPLLKQGPANHFRGMEGVGGWLSLIAEDGLAAVAVVQSVVEHPADGARAVLSIAPGQRVGDGESTKRYAPPLFAAFSPFAAHHLVFVRLTDSIREPIRKAITRAIRHGLLGY